MPTLIKDSKELSLLEKWIEEAEKEARKSKCLKSKVGVVIVKDDKIISRGYNKIVVSDRAFLDQNGYCTPCIRENIHNNSYVERCYAIHAEQMALIKAREDLEGATMYHVKIKNEKRVPIVGPTCTVCNRIIKEAGIYFVCLQNEGYIIYSPWELVHISFKKFLVV